MPKKNSIFLSLLIIAAPFGVHSVFAAAYTPQPTDTYAMHRCPAGTYLPANRSGCVDCPAGNNYCPGGSYRSPSDEDQGIFECPSGATVNSDHSACVITLNETKMKYGPKGKNTKFNDQCWTKTSAREYANCLFPNGIRSGNNRIIKVELQSAQMNVAEQQVEK
jgi:hypothetical protein